MDINETDSYIMCNAKLASFNKEKSLIYLFSFCSSSRAYGY
jgi:hypothetical protein